MSFIRPIAISVILHRGRLLAFEASQHVAAKPIYRPLGGGIEFGEYGHQTIVREMREEAGAEIEEVRHLGTLENIFTHQGEQGHEIVFVYAARFSNPELYACDSLNCVEANGMRFTAEWVPVARFQRQEAVLVPLELLDLLVSHGLALEPEEEGALCQ